MERRLTQLKNRLSLNAILQKQQKDIVVEQNKIKKLITSCDDYDKDTRLFEKLKRKNTKILYFKLFFNLF